MNKKQRDELNFAEMTDEEINQVWKEPHCEDTKKRVSPRPPSQKNLLWKLKTKYLHFNDRIHNALSFSKDKEELTITCPHCRKIQKLAIGWDYQLCEECHNYIYDNRYFNF